MKGITAKSTRPNLTNGTIPTDAKLHNNLSTGCETSTSSSTNSYSLAASKANSQHSSDVSYLPKSNSKSTDSNLTFQEQSIPTDSIKTRSNPILSTEDSQQSTTPDSSFMPSPNLSSSSASTSPRSVSRSKHNASDVTAIDDSTLSSEIQIRSPLKANHKRTELFTKLSNNKSDQHENNLCDLHSKSTDDIESPASNDLSISVTSPNDIHELTREIKSEISSPLGYKESTEMIKSNSTSDLFECSTPITSIIVTTSILVANTNEPLKVNASSSNSTGTYSRSKVNYTSRDTEHTNSPHNFSTNRRKSRYASYNNNNNNNSYVSNHSHGTMDFSSLNLKSLLNNKYMKNLLMQPFFMPDCMNASGYTTVNNYDLAHLRKSIFNKAAAAAAAASLLPDPSLFINSPCYYWLPSTGFSNTTPNTANNNNNNSNTNTTYSTDCIKLYSDKISNTNGNTNPVYINGSSRFMLPQFNGQQVNNHGIGELKSCEILNENMMSTSASKASVPTDEMNHSKRESTQPLANNGNNLNKSLTNSISQSMTKLNSLTPDDAVNCASGNFDNRPASAKDLSINDATIKQYKDNTPLPNTSVYKSMNSKVNKTDNLISSENNYDKIGSIKYAPAELSPDLMVVNMTNSLGQPISVITNSIQIDTSQIQTEEMMNGGSTSDTAASVPLSSSVGTVTSTTSGTAVTPNYIPNPDSYLTTTPTTFFYFCNNEGQLFAVPSNTVIFPTAVGRLNGTAVSNDVTYSSTPTFIASQVNGGNNNNNTNSNNSNNNNSNNGSNTSGNNPMTLRTNGCISNYDIPYQLYSGTDYSAMLKQTDNSSCRELISGYSVPIQPSYLNGFPQWIPNQITVDNQNGSQQLQNASANPLVLPTNQGVILHPSCPFPLPSMGLIQPLISNVFPNQSFNTASNVEENGVNNHNGNNGSSSSSNNNNNHNSTKQKNSQQGVSALLNRSNDQIKLRRFTNDLPSLLGNAKSTRSGTGSGKLSNSGNNHSKYAGKSLVSSFLDEYNNAMNSQSAANRQKKHASKTNLYIRGLPTTFTEEELHTLAPDRNLIRSVKLITGAEGEMYGFIDFVNNEAAKSALLHIKSGNRELYVNFAYESEKDPQNVYITNIPESWTASNVEDLKEIFQPYGQIATAIVMTKRSNNFCTGAGFVRFVRPEDAQKAIDGIRSAQITLENGKGPLEVKLADRQKPSEDQSNSTKSRQVKRSSEPPESTTPGGLINGSEESSRHSRTRKQSDCLLPNENQLGTHGNSRLRSTPGVLGPATDFTSWDVTNRLNNSDSFMLALRAAWASNTLQNQNFLLRNSIGQNSMPSSNENNRGLLPIPNPTGHLTSLVSQQKVPPPNGLLHNQTPVQHGLVTGPTAAAAAAAAAVTALLPFSRPIDSYSLSQALMHTPVTPTMIGPMIQPAGNWTASPLISNIYQSI
uniref:RRM domain-containing protein n=1 Tax=Trichobilharzia regenti TaxID=157069 RepID=A0AA85J8N2_TRIRE|nr:unnamed protein product [Trichobilharzia regenti]